MRVSILATPIHSCSRLAARSFTSHAAAVLGTQLASSALQILQWHMLPIIAELLGGSGAQALDNLCRSGGDEAAIVK